jgi:hypothetical protein
LARDPHTVIGGPRVFQSWGHSTGTAEETMFRSGL